MTYINLNAVDKKGINAGLITAPSAGFLNSSTFTHFTPRLVFKNAGLLTVKPAY